VLRAASDKSLAAAEAVHRQQVEQLEQQLSAARALACTTEDSAAQQAAHLQQQLQQQQQVVLQLEQQVQQLRCELQQAAQARQAATATQVHTQGATLFCLIAGSSSANCCLHVLSAYLLTHTRGSPV